MGLNFEQSVYRACFVHWCLAGQQQAHSSPSRKSDTKSVKVFPLINSSSCL